MATIQDIATNNNYRGDVALGGGSQGQFKPDLSAFQRLADFSYFKAKDDDEQERKQKEKDVAEVSEALAIDYSSIPDKWRQDVIDKLKDFQDYYQQNPDAVRVQSGKYGDYLKKKTELANLAKAGTARGVEYKAAQAEINNTVKDEGERKAKLDMLKSQMEKGNIFTSFEGVPKQIGSIDLSAPEVAEKFGTVGADTNTETGVKFFNYLKGHGQSIADAASVSDLTKSPALRALEEANKARTAVVSDIGKMGPVDYDNAPLASRIKAWNEMVLKAKVTTIGETGKTLADMMGGLPPMIDETKPLSLEQMLDLVKFEKNGGQVLLDENLTQTNTATQKEKMRLDYKVGMYNAETSRGQLGLEKKKYDDIVKGSKIDPKQSSLSIAYAEKLKSKLKAWADENGGVITSANLAKLTDDEKKALGVGVFSNNQTSLDPLDVKTTTTAVIDKDGIIQIKDGTSVVSSHNIYSIGSKNLAEQTLLGSGKETAALNSAYSQLLGVSDNPSAATTTFTPIPAQVDPTTLKVNEGYTVNGKNYIWDGKKLNPAK